MAISYTVQDESEFGALAKSGGTILLIFQQQLILQSRDARKENVQ